MGTQAPAPLRPALRPRAGRSSRRWSSPTSSTKLGLDLKGGVELVYQGQPTGQVEEVTGEDIDRSIEIIRERIDQLGVSEPEVSRLGTDRDLGQPARRHRRPAGDRPGRHDRAALLLRLGAEPDRPRAGDRRPPRPAAAAEGRSNASKNAGKKPAATPTSAENQQLIFAGAYPTAYEAAQLAAEQQPVEDCEQLLGRASRATTSSRKTAPHDLIAGPGVWRRRTSTSARPGKNGPNDGHRRRSPGGHDRRLRIPDRRSRQGRRRPPSPAGTRCKDNPALSGTDITDPKQELRRIQRAERHLQLHRRRPRGLPGRHPRRSPSAARRRRSGRSAANRRQRSPGHFAVDPRQRSQDAADHQLRRKPRRDRRPHRRPDLRRLHRHRARPRTWRRRCRSAPCRSTSS